MKYNYCKTCGKQMTPWTTDALLGRLKNLDCGGDCWECISAIEKSMGYEDDLVDCDYA